MQNETAIGPAIPRPVFRRRLLILTLLVFLCLIANIAGPALLWKRQRFGDMTEFLRFLAVGGLVAQIEVISMWSAIGTQPFMWRLPATAFLAVVVSSSFVLGLQLPEWPTSSLPESVGIFLISVGVVGFFVGYLLLVCIFWLGQTRLIDAQNPTCLESDGKYSLQFLIGLTTIIAVAIAVVKLCLPNASREPLPPSREILMITTMLSQHGLLTVLLTWSCVLLFLSNNRRWIGGIGVVVLLFLSPINLWVIASYTPFGMDLENFSYYACFLIGLVATLSVFLRLLRIGGFRLSRVEQGGS